MNTATAALPSKAKGKGQRPMNQVIQIARRQLGLDDDTYQDFLKSITGKTSTRDMSDKELYLVVQALKKDAGHKVGRPGDASQFQSEHAKRARHEWLKLKNYGELRDSSERALLSYARRITKVSRMEWLKPSEMNLLVETLKNWVARVEYDLTKKAVASGKLALPEGFSAFEELEAFWKGKFTPEGNYFDALISFRAAQEVYLDSFWPQK